MTKFAKTPKIVCSSSDIDANDPGNDSAEGAPENASLFKPRPAEEEHFDPLDLANNPEDIEQEDLHPSALADQGSDEAPTQWHWWHPDGLSVEDVDRQDRALAAVEFGRPRAVWLSTGPYTVMRLTQPPNSGQLGEGAGSDLTDHKEKLQLKIEADKPLQLVGPATEHAIDELASTLFARAPSFREFLRALRESAYLSLARGANFFHFQPMLIVSAPGMGKTTVTRFLAEASGLPAIYLDGSTMMTTVAITGGDAVFRSSRPSSILTGMIQHGVGNPLVIFDEVDKLADMSHGARQHPAEALLPFLEQRTAGQVREHYVQVDLDLRFLNWVLLANDLDKVPRTVRDRCKVIQIPPLTPKNLAAVAEAEVLRRHLEPEIVAALSRACANGQIKSLRKLNKALDAAQATLRRPRFHRSHFLQKRYKTTGHSSMTIHQKISNLPAVAAKGGAVVPLAGSAPAVSIRRATQRTIKTVSDARGPEAVLMPVDAVLDGLTPMALTALRRKIGSMQANGEILFRCGQCESPVQITGSRLSSTGDGRGAFFKHAKSTPPGCSWKTGDNLRSLGAAQFGGNQEGEPHKRLKACLADSLRLDPDFAEPLVDKHYIGIGEGRRKPDVYTVYKGQPIAFEVQLARMPISTINGRTTAYRQAGITLVWVTSAQELAALNKQAFRDLYLASGGRIFAVDTASYERSEATGVFHLRELSLEPCIQQPFAIFNRWRSRMVGPEVILMPEAQRHAEGQRAYGTALAEKLQAQAPGLTENIANAVLTDIEITRVAAEWSALAKLVGGRGLRQSIQDELPRALFWLQAVERLAKATGPGREHCAKVVAGCAAHIVAAHNTGKHWTPLIEHVADAVPAVTAALSPELRAMMIRLMASPGRLHPYHVYHRHMIAALHPWLSFWLLAKSPSGLPPHQRQP